MRGQGVLFAGAHIKAAVEAGKSSDDWQTPQAFFDLLNEEFNFTLDPCASTDNAKAAFFDKETDGLAQDWGTNVCFVNFPYSAALAWSKKCVEAMEGGATVIVLCAARTDTEWFHTLVAEASEVRFVKGRLKFVPPDDRESTTAGFPSVVVVLTPKHRSGTKMKLWTVPAEARQ